MAPRQMRKRIDKRQAGSQTFRRPGGTDDHLAIETSRGRRTGTTFWGCRRSRRQADRERDDGLVEVAGRSSGNLPRWIRLRGRAGQAVRLRVAGYDRRERLPADGQERHRGGWRQVWRRGQDVRIQDCGRAARKRQRCGQRGRQHRRHARLRIQRHRQGSCKGCPGCRFPDRRPVHRRPSREHPLRRLPRIRGQLLDGGCRRHADAVEEGRCGRRARYSLPAPLHGRLCARGQVGQPGRASRYPLGRRRQSVCRSGARQGAGCRDECRRGGPHLHGIRRRRLRRVRGRQGEELQGILRRHQSIAPKCLGSSSTRA